jgi:multidrug efflux pump subunit AcrA (membrane-fusion protein)
MKKLLLRIGTWVLVIVVIAFIASAFVRAQPPKRVAPPPDLAEAPARVYGRIEPAGGEVYVSAPVSRSITSILVHEGDTVAKDQLLCVLENTVEQADAQAAQTRIAAAEKTLAISTDVWHRNQSLSETHGVTESDLTQSRLKVDLDQALLDQARSDAGLSAARLAQLELRSPIRGKVYRFDVRLGQTLTAGDNSLIVLGATTEMARLYVESYWSNRVRMGDHYLVLDAETGDTIGMGHVTSIAPYLGSRNFRTDDPTERLDTDYQEVVLSFPDLTRTVPIGLKVVAELAGK